MFRQIPLLSAVVCHPTDSLVMLEHELRLLALDGGSDIEGLSSLQILKKLMDTVDPGSSPKPCDYFDMIGGTGTGGFVTK